MRIALVFAVATMSLPAIAGDVYRCQDAAGKIEFRDRPCDPGQKAQKLDVVPNTIGTMTLEEVRTKSAELKARQQARQDAENRANSDAYSAQERTSEHERALQDAIDAQQILRDNGVNNSQNGFYSGQPRAQAAPSPPPPPPKPPAMPTAPPKPLTPG
jgi:Domain of unknown function (DUF4124)